MLDPMIASVWCCSCTDDISIQNTKWNYLSPQMDFNTLYNIMNYQFQADIFTDKCEKILHKIDGVMIRDWGAAIFDLKHNNYNIFFFENA